MEVEGSARTKIGERVSGNGNFEQTYFRTALLLDLSLISPIRYMKNAANFGKISRSKKLQTQGQCQIEFFFIYGTILCDQPSIIKIETACTTFGHEIINWLLLSHGNVFLVSIVILSDFWSEKIYFQERLYTPLKC